MKFIFIFLFLFLISCNSIKVRKIELDTCQELIGKIQKINSSTYHYPIFEKDTNLLRKEKSTIFFDKKNNILKKVDDSLEFPKETLYNYNNRLLESTISKCKNKIRKENYKYDKHNNLIEFNQFENDTISLSKTSIYDSKNNPIKKTYFHPNYKNKIRIDKYIYNYKKRMVIIQSFDENDKANENFIKINYDKNGFIIKSDYMIKSLNKYYSSLTINQYDKKGNVIERTNYDRYGNPMGTTIYKNSYDKIGNIIVREIYYKDKLIEKSTYEIIYW